MSAVPCVFLWLPGESNAFYNKDEYNCSFPAMIDDWRMAFHQASGGQTEDDFPFGFVQVSCTCIASRPSSHIIYPSIHLACEKTTGQMQYTVSPVNLTRHLHVLAALYLHQVQQGPELPRNPLAPDGRLWFCSQPADEENLHGRSSGSTG